MSITNYTELQSSIANWLHRTDLTAVIPDFIALAETRISSLLDSRLMEARTTMTCTPGPTLAARYVAFPADMVEMKRLVLLLEPVIVLEYKSPDQLNEDNPYQLTPGRPMNFTVVGSSLELSPPPDQAYSLELIYQQRVPPLTSSNLTNWVLTTNPSIYLYAALVEASVFMQDEEELARWEQKFQLAIKATNSIDWYTGSTMRVKVR